MSKWLLDNLEGVAEDDRTMFLACVEARQLDGEDEG